ncbi:MAG: hypothetical protein QME05_03985 [Candidatus Margulisbacteria bacterium]|nr:hypothetical protein [Candidatus Margulisiibacteriota bacterium]
MLLKVKPVFSGFNKPGEKVTEVDGVYILEGEGVDIGCNLVIQEEIKKPSLLEFEIRGKINKKVPWARLRIEIFDLKNVDEPAESYEDNYLTVDLSPKVFKHLSFPILGIVKIPHRVQFMVVGPAKSKLEIKNVVLR